MLAHTHARRGASDSEAAIVLLHGFLGDRRDVEPLRQKLGALADCISLDLPGHGDSAWMPTIHAGTSAVDAALATLEALCPPPARLLLVGYSMGGRVALQLAARLPPPRLAGLVILSGSPGLDDGALREARLSRDVALAARLRAMTPPHFDEWLRREWYRAALWGGRLQEHPSFERMLLRRTDGAQPRDRAASLERESVGRQPSCWPWLEAPPAPVLYVAGEEDEAYRKVATRLAEHSGGLARGGEEAWRRPALTVGSTSLGVAEPVERRLVRVAVLPAAGHALLLEAPHPTSFANRSDRAKPRPRNPIGPRSRRPPRPSLRYATPSRAKCCHRRLCRRRRRQRRTCGFKRVGRKASTRCLRVCCRSVCR